MNDIRDLFPGRMRERTFQLKARRDTGVAWNEPQFVECKQCGRRATRQIWAKSLFVCPNCGNHQPIGAYYRLSLVLDSGSFRELDAELEKGGDTAERLRRFMKRHRLPFLATDRSVLNLPAIGKSMSFRLVGITPEGRRILRFDHDRTRRHSPIIDRMGEIYIVENKSLAAYLRQLENMGEDADDYASIWNYTHGETEPRFGLYVYPDFGFATTDRVSNLELE